MAVIKHRQAGTAPQIVYSDIYIPDDKNIGTGQYSVFLKPEALSGNEQISSIVFNPKLNFQISVNFNPAALEVLIFLGKSNQAPSAKKLYAIPKKINISTEHEFVVVFENWHIKELRMDGISL